MSIELFGKYYGYVCVVFLFFIVIWIMRSQDKQQKWSEKQHLKNGVFKD